MSEFPVRTGVTVVAPILAAVAIVGQVLWERDLDPDWAAGLSLVSTPAAVVVAAWAILVAPSRSGQIAGIVSLLVAVATAVLWFYAWAEILRTT